MIVRCERRCRRPSWRAGANGERSFNRPLGAGKSTLLQMIVGLLDSGTRLTDDPLAQAA
jgi:hypothetical protein